MDYEKISAGLSFLMRDKRITIVHGVLKSLGISPRRDDYDDFVQEASLVFAHAYANYPQDETDPTNERDLMCYAFQRMRWRILDHLRRDQLEKAHCTYSLDDDENNRDYDDLLIDRQSTNPFAHREEGDFLGYLYQHCSPNQQRYLIAKLNHHLTDKQVALTYGVSRQAVHQWKQGVISRAHQLRAKMNGKFWGEKNETTRNQLPGPLAPHQIQRWRPRRWMCQRAEHLPDPGWPGTPAPALQHWPY